MSGSSKDTSSSSKDSSNSPLRPLLPAPADRRGIGVGTGFVARSSISRKRTAISAACDYCRKRKIRCDGARPSCSSCVRSENECHYVTVDAEESRWHAIKRKYDDSQQALGMHEDLYRMLATRPAEEAQTILERIRQGSNVDEIISRVQAGDLLLQMTLAPEQKFRFDFPDIRNLPLLFQDPFDPYIKSPLFTPPVPELQDIGSLSHLAWPRHVYEIPYSGAQIMDSRISSVDASYWTSVTKDNKLVAGLISLYLSTIYVTYPPFNKDLFLDDMIAKRSRFCSSLLINAICTAGIHASKEYPLRAEWWRLDSLAYVFMAETKRLYELESQEGSLTTIQAAAIISQRLVLDGQDKVASLYEIYLTAMMEKIELYSPPPVSTGARMHLSWFMTAWGIFGWKTTWSYYMLKPPFTKTPPKLPLPSYQEVENIIDDFMLLYPLASAPTARHWPSMWLALMTLRVIQHDIALIRYTDDGKVHDLTLAEAVGFYKKLQSWCNGLPEFLQPASLVFPQDYDLHLEYLHLLIDLSEPWSNGSKPLDLTILDQFDPNEIASTARARMESIIRLYYTRHGFCMQDAILTTHLLMLGSIAALKINLEPATTRESFSTLSLCAKGLSDASQNDYIGNLLMQGLQAAVQRCNNSTIEEFVRISSQYKPVIVKPEHIQTGWPVYQWIDKDNEELSLIIKQLNELSTQERDSSSNPESSPSS